MRMGKNIRLAIRQYSIKKQLELALERYKRRKLYNLDCDKEADRIAREIENKKM